MCCSKGKTVRIRPHHGMCLAYFEGKGYSEGFTAHMGRILNLLEQDKAALVRVVVDTDVICGECPNNQDSICKEKERVRCYDEAVLKACGLKEGQEIRFWEFAELVQEKILASGRRSEICADCQWDEICCKKESRWAKIR